MRPAQPDLIELVRRKLRRWELTDEQIDEVLESTTRLIANHAALRDPWKRQKIDNIALMLQSCLAAEGKVGLMMNVRRDGLVAPVTRLPMTPIRCGST